MRCVRPLASYAAAAPATVSGEPKTITYHWDHAILGRWSEAATREPGNLLPAKSHARTRRAGCSEALREPAWSAATKGERQISRQPRVTVYLFAVERHHVHIRNPSLSRAIASCVRAACSICSPVRRCSSLTTSAWSQSTIGPIQVSPPKPQTATRQGADQRAAPETRQARRAKHYGQTSAAAENRTRADAAQQQCRLRQRQPSRPHRT